MIRHAVSIDERRAKFRQDLLGESKPTKTHRHHHKHHQDGNQEQHQRNGGRTPDRGNATSTTDRFRRPSQARPTPEKNKPLNSRLSVPDEEGRLAPRQSSPAKSRERSLSLAYGEDGDASSINTDTSQLSIAPPRPLEDEADADEAAEQDIEELWFPGCHADLGGGWPLSTNEEFALSHAPLVWMVREAQRAGLDFDREKMIRLKCCDDKYNDWSDSYESSRARDPGIPEVQVTSSSNPNIYESPKSETPQPGWAPGMKPEEPKQSEFHRCIYTSATKGMLHDCLEFKNGLPAMSVLSWKTMEYLPFRRMDLQPDGSWRAITFP